MTEAEREAARENAIRFFTALAEGQARIEAKLDALLAMTHDMGDRLFGRKRTRVSAEDLAKAVRGIASTSDVVRQVVSGLFGAK